MSDEYRDQNMQEQTDYTGTDQQTGSEPRNMADSRTADMRQADGEPAAGEDARRQSQATTYSWVNPRISGRADNEDNSAGFTGTREQGASGAGYGWQSQYGQYGQYSQNSQNSRAQDAGQSAGPGAGQTRPGGTYGTYQYQTGPQVTPEAPQQKKPRKKKEKKPMSTGKRWALNIAMAACFGLVAGGVFLGTAALGRDLLGSDQPVSSVTIPTTTTAAGSGSVPVETSGGMTVKDVADSAMPSLVSISTVTVEEVRTFFGTTSQEVPASGSGVIVGQNDTELLIATNNHVVTGAKELSVSFIDDATVEGQIKGTDVGNDLAVVAVKLSDISDETKSAIKVAVMGNSDELEIGDQVIAIGNALGIGQSLTSGYVSAKDRSIESQDEMTGETTTSEGLIQTDAAINPGNSGGALLNMRGELIGINEAKYSSTQVEGMGFAIPISKAEPILKDLMNLVTRYKVDENEASYIGITMADVNSAVSESYGIPTGVCIMQVEKDSPAEAAGLKRGDVITKFDGRGVSNSSSLQDILSYYAAGEEVELTVQRANEGEYKEVSITLTLGSAKDKPASGEEEEQDAPQNPFSPFGD